VLSFTLEREGRTIQICADDEGIDRFVAALLKLKETGHLHLWGKEMGGFLSDEDPFGCSAVTDVSMTIGKSHLAKPGKW
jgi:hypothetical protein